MRIETYCRYCGETHTVTLNASQSRRYVDWSRGNGNIQDQLFDLSKEERELILSGTCCDCWNEMWKEDWYDEAY